MVDDLSQQMQRSRRGLASAPLEVRLRVAKAGGNAPHEKRGLQAASQELREAIARKGGIARGEQLRRKITIEPKDALTIPVQI
jgi:hypothetical protein